MAEYLFVGGPNDGEWRSVLEHRPLVVIEQRVPVDTTGAIYAANKFQAEGPGYSKTVTKSAAYEKLTLRLPSGSLSLFIWQEINGIEAIHRLLHSYTPTVLPDGGTHER